MVTPRSDEGNERFLNKMLLLASATLAVGTALPAVVHALFGTNVDVAIGPAVVSVISVAAFVLGWFGRTRAGALLIVYGNFTPVAISLVAMPAYPSSRLHALMVFSILGAFLIGARHALYVSSGGIAAFLLCIGRLALEGQLPARAAPDVVADVVHVVIVTLLMFFFARRLSEVIAELATRLEHSRALFQRLPPASGQLGAAARELSKTTEHHREGALRQSATVEETQRALHQIRSASQEIVGSAQDTSRNAETTRKNSEVVSEHVLRLRGYSTRIGELLELIREVANRTDVLALNAGLEGVKAGEAGRGFQLVALKMQDVAQKVAGAVGGIKQLIDDMERDLDVTSASTSETLELARATARNAQQISVVVRHQQESLQSVLETVGEVSKIAVEFSSESAETMQSTEDLRQLAEQLDQLVEEFTSRERSIG
jgi:ABC-type transporter Mla subunit MlaD